MEALYFTPETVDIWYEYAFYTLCTIEVIAVFTTLSYAFRIPGATTLQEKYHYQIMSALLGICTIALLGLIIIFNQVEV